MQTRKNYQRHFQDSCRRKGPGNGLRPQNGAEGLSGGQPSSLMLKEGDAESGLSTDNSVYRKGNKQHPTGNVDVLFKHQGICFFY